MLTDEQMREFFGINNNIKIVPLEESSGTLSEEYGECAKDTEKTKKFNELLGREIKIKFFE